MNPSSKKIILLPFLALFALLLLTMPRVAKLSLDYSKGQPWKAETLIAPFDFPILKTNEQILDEMSGSGASQFTPYYRFSSETVDKNLKTAENLDLGEFNFLKGEIVSTMSNLFNTGIVGDDGVVSDGNGNTPQLLYIQKDKRASSFPSEEVYKLSDARSVMLKTLSASNPDVNVDSVLSASGVYNLVVPVLSYDKQTTDLVAANNNTVSPTLGYVKAGQLIVSQGEIVTAEIAQMLDSYKKEYEANMGYSGSDILFWIGNGILAAAIVLLLYLAILYCDPSIFGSMNRLLYLLMILTIFMLAGILVPRFEPGLLYMVPFTLCPLILQPFYKNRLILACYAISLLPLLICAEQGIVIYTVFLVGGIVCIYTSSHLSKGWRQFLNALVVYAVLMLVYTGFRCIDMVGGGMLRPAVLLFAAAMLPIAGYPLTFLFERVFNLVSPTRLTELADISNPLLQELEKKAPGTFQHSLQVMNMADAAARAIGADVALVRAGALYHDIGKMRNPRCFIENESMLGVAGENSYHSGQTPQQSASDIIRHVSDGVEIAQKHHLPSVVIDFIRTHHGTQRQAYFYDKFLKDGGDPAQASEFEYHGSKPQTQEQIILMLCDSVEAASRTLKDYSAKSFETFVESIVSGKMASGQFEDAQITVKGLETVKTVLKNYLSQIYHERIAYPKTKNNKQ